MNKVKRNRKPKMSNERAKQLEERIVYLLSLKQAELKGDKSKSYIADLNDSIKGCEAELSFHHKNPNGVEFVNGV